MTERIEKCHICDEKADVGTPYIDSNSKLYCHVCAKETEGKFLIGIKQWTDEKGDYITIPSYFQDGVVIIFYNDKPSVWYESGLRSFYLTKNERENFSVSETINKIKDMRRNNLHRCSSCGEYFSEELANFPLFAGVNCPDCWEKHLERIEKDKQTGNVCSKCRKPRSICCC